MTNPFRIAADHLLTLKPQFEQLTNLGRSGEASYWLPAARPVGFDGWEPVLHGADNSTHICSNGVTLEPRQLSVPAGEKPPPWAAEFHFEGDTKTFWLMEPAVYSFCIHTSGRPSTPGDCEALSRFNTAAAYAGNCLRSIDLSHMRFADARTPLFVAAGSQEAFWLLIVFDLAWQRRPGGLHANRERLWRSGNTTYAIHYG
jgi:hypothetical protein